MAGDNLDNEFDAAQKLGENVLNRAVGEPGEPEDLESVEQLIREHPKARELYELLKDPDQLLSILDGLECAGGHSSEDLERLLSQINPVPRQQPVQRSIRKSIYYFAAAAAVLLIVFGTILHYISRKNITEKGYISDIRPGSNRAVLTLADGSSITLDSANSGILAHQAGYSIKKTSDGTIRYEKASASNTIHAEVAMNTLSTPRGGQYQLILPDGSKAWLNAGSSLRYPASFAGMGTRTVELTGEAYFEIAANKSVPFLVNAGRTSIKVLGTHFNVMAYSDEKDLETTLLEGAVQIDEGGRSKTIRPGEQARINIVANTAKGNRGNSSGADDQGISVVKVEPEEYIAWQQGRIRLHDADVAAVMRQISRWYDVTVEYDPKSNTQSALTFGGVVSRKLTLNEVIKVLELGKIHCKLLEGRRLQVSVN